jgi:hypothetical protein
MFFIRHVTRIRYCSGTESMPWSHGEAGRGQIKGDVALFRCSGALQVPNGLIAQDNDPSAQVRRLDADGFPSLSVRTNGGAVWAVDWARRCATRRSL